MFRNCFSVTVPTPIEKSKSQTKVLCVLWENDSIFINAAAATQIHWENKDTNVFLTTYIMN